MRLSVIPTWTYEPAARLKSYVLLAEALIGAGGGR